MNNKRFMKGFLSMRTFAFVAVMCCTLMANAQLSQSELSQLDKNQLNMYLSQSKDLANQIKQLEEDLIKAEYMIKLGEEMKSDNAKFAGTERVIRGMNLKEATQKRMDEVKKMQSALDKAAREAIKKKQEERRKQEEKKKMGKPKTI